MNLIVLGNVHCETPVAFYLCWWMRLTVPGGLASCCVGECVWQYPEGWQENKETDESTKQKEKGSRGRKRKRQFVSDEENDSNNGEGVSRLLF